MQFAETTACGMIVTDPRLDKAADGKTVCNFDLSVSHPNPSGGRIQIFHVSILGKNAAVVWGSVKKGDEVAVIGQASARQYKDGAGENHCVLDLHCNFIRYSQAAFDRQNAAS